MSTLPDSYARPDVSAHVEAEYARLPQMYRDGDEANDFAVLRILSVVGDQRGDVSDVVDRLLPEETNDLSELVDPMLADYDWLPWLAMMAGVDARLYPDTDGNRTALRLAIDGARGGRYPGSDAAIIAAVRPALTGTRAARITNKSVAGFSYSVEVYAAQVDDQAALAVLLSRTTPAGLTATLSVLPGWTWGDVLATGRTWGDVKNSGQTWGQSRATIPDRAGWQTWGQATRRTWAQARQYRWNTGPRN